jgi:hypothetical protein
VSHVSLPKCRLTFLFPSRVGITPSGLVSIVKEKLVRRNSLCCTPSETVSLRETQASFPKRARSAAVEHETQVGSEACSAGEQQSDVAVVWRACFLFEVCSDAALACGVRSHAVVEYETQVGFEACSVGEQQSDVAVVWRACFLFEVCSDAGLARGKRFPAAVERGNQLGSEPCFPCEPRSCVRVSKRSSVPL